MKKLLPKILGSGLVVTAFIATVLCCNPMIVAAAGIITGKSVSSCGHCKTDPSENGKTCCIKQLQGVLIEKQTSQQIDDLQFLSGISKDVNPPQLTFHNSK